MERKEELRFRNVNGRETAYLIFNAIEKTRFAEGLFTTRGGGVSNPPYDDLSFSRRCGDTEENVRENFQIASKLMNTVPERCVLSSQSHHVMIRTVTEEDAGKGLVRERDYCDIDALITNVQDLTLITVHGDCTPLYFVDPVHKAIGMAHSGWKGTVGRIGARTLEAMHREYGTCPEDVTAVIGPCSHGCCYEIGPEVAIQFEALFGKESAENEKILMPGAGDRSMLDTALANRRILLDAGIAEENLTVSDYCTCCHPELFFSHRKPLGTRRGNCAAMLKIRT